MKFSKETCSFQFCIHLCAECVQLVVHKGVELTIHRAELCMFYLVKDIHPLSLPPHIKMFL